MAEFPTGTVTFLFTDLVASSRLWEEYPEAMQVALARHDAILRDAVAGQGGQVVKSTGDGVHAAFGRAEDAVAAAVEAQRALDAERWAETGPLRVRMGLHTGTAETRQGDYFGPALNRAARLTALAHGGQALVSHATEAVVHDALAGGVELEDLGEHRLRDLSRPERVFQLVHADLPREFPPLRSLDALPSNLPFQVTTFVGREEELREVSEVLGEARVVTLTGVGGVGKTRLAVQTAAELLPRFADGAWLCELGPLSDPGAVPAVVATVLSIQPQPGKTLIESIVVALRHREMLILLDNCEHLIDPAAQLVDEIVRSCPGVRVLATSREGLGMSGERLLLVRSLGLPGEHAGVEELAHSDAARLFVDRTAATRRGFAVDEANAAAVTQICRRLDGIPLAIELAAARTRVMSPGEIAGRLDERFRLLTGGSRTAVERHQTLRAAVDWSYGLLKPEERVLLDRLGVFAGGFTLDAAETVGVDDEGWGGDVLDHLAQLVDKSLVVAEEDADGGTRYRLLETIRQYAIAHLNDAEATDAIRRRHAQWCVRLVADAAAGSRGRDEPRWVRRLDRELENLRSAITWATGANEIDLSMELLGPLPGSVINTPFGYALGPWAAAALRIPGATRHPRLGAVLALRAADHRLHDRLADAERDACDAIDAVLRPETSFSSLPWGVLLNVYAYSGRVEQFLERHEEFLSAARRHGHDYEIAFSLSLVAINLMAVGRAEDGRGFAEEALRLAERVGAPSVIAVAANALSGAIAEQDPERARTLVELCLENALSIGGDLPATIALGALGRTGTTADDPRWATRFRGVMDRTYDAGDTRLLLVQLDMYAHTLLQIGRVEPSAVLFGTVGRHARHLANPVSTARRETQRSGLVAALGDDRFTDLVAHGESLDLADAVALARHELDRVINGLPTLDA
jgi:predicted ATPase/class 3 adenylate cyclase